MEIKGKQREVSFLVKLTTIALIIAFTLSYSIVKKRQIDKLTSENNNLILKKLPKFSFPVLKNDSLKFLSNENIFAGDPDAIFIHFWGTWCGPCEAELPEFLEFIESAKNYKVKVVLLAVKDNDKLINKFMKKFGSLPSNIILAHDESGKSMVQFGTVKVPETYLFSRSGKSLNKYVGPQDWKQSMYKDRLDFYLSGGEVYDDAVRIETH